MRSSCLIGAVAGLSAFFGIAQGSQSAAQPAAGDSGSHASVLTADQVIQILDETVDWYRTLGVQQQSATQPSDLLSLYASRQTADEVVRLAFQIARANAELLSSEAGGERPADEGSSPQALEKEQSSLESQVTSLQQAMSPDRQRLAAGKNKQDIEAKMSELQSELDMVNARKNLLDTMTEFVNENDAKRAGANALKAQIDAIAATIPALSAPTATAAPTSSPIAEAAKPPPASQGIWDLSADVFRLRGKLGTIRAIDRSSAGLAETFQKISAPPRQQLLAYSSHSEALASRARSTTGEALKTLRGEFDTLAWLFKQTSAILIPLTQEQVLLEQYRHDLSSWTDATKRQYNEALRTLGVRLCILIVMLAAVLAVGEIWRRAVLRYAHEARRRSQLLLVRRIVLWTLIVAIVSLSFVTHIGTFVTFTGLLTAGVAVALQSVLVSIVGYFFLIGKHGIRVGDRVQIGAVVGDVIELGLVRMHLMELQTSGSSGPTGRVVAFPNLIVFQSTAGLFKQIPGVNLSWHETSVELPSVDDYAALKDKLLVAVSTVLAEYRDEFMRQARAIEESTAAVVAQGAAAQIQMHLANGRMEALIRYPVSLEHAAAIDERVSEVIFGVLAGLAKA